MGLLESLVFTCVIRSGLIQSRLLEKHLQKVAGGPRSERKGHGPRRRANIGESAAPPLIYARRIRSVKLWRETTRNTGEKNKKNNLTLEKSCLFLKLPFYLPFLLYIAWPWAPLWHDDMLSTLMVYDGIKALSGGHRRRSEPRPWVALDGRGAVISVPHCQSWPPPPSLKNLSICHISGGRPSARHALFSHSLSKCRAPSERSCRSLH